MSTRAGEDVRGGEDGAEYSAASAGGVVTACGVGGEGNGDVDCGG
jgi:hypothetical protein